MAKGMELIGQKFGLLTVIEKSKQNSKRGRFWVCHCECGNTKEKPVRTSHLTKARVISCGCVSKYNRAHFGDRWKTHGCPNKKLYWVWSAMKGRCLNKSNKQYKDYGERGIDICVEWINYEHFYKWAIENGYKQGLTIDRLDNDKGYNPSNCRWADNFQQSQNRRSNHFVTHEGQTKTLAEWGRDFGIKENTLYTRLKRGHELFAPLRDTAKNFKNCINDRKTKP